MRWFHGGLVAAFFGLLVVACDFGEGFGGGRRGNSRDTGDFCFDTGEADLVFADFDEDGFGDVDAALSRCDAPQGWVENDEDCDDSDATINPDATDTCGDEVDQDCDGADATCSG